MPAPTEITSARFGKRGTLAGEKLDAVIQEKPMAFRITGLPPESFSNLFELTDEQLRAHNAMRVIALADGGYPCRISLQDAAPGDELILTHYEHHPVESPFRASHAIYIRAGQQRYDAVDTVPAQLRTRLLSLRSFDANALLIDADIVDGHALESGIQRMFDDDRSAYVHIHFAKPGCYASRVDRI
jgi:hypothetical protein